MFGQVAQTQAPAKYLPATKQQQHQSGKLHAPHPGASGVIGPVPKWLLIALAGLVVLAASGLTLPHLLHSGTGTQAKPGTITAFSLPTASSSPWGITAGPDGNLWFTESRADQIGRITPAGTITEFPLPTAYTDPAGITAGPDGNLWFTVSTSETSVIGRITPAGKVTEFRLPLVGMNFYSITLGPDGNLWFTEYYASIIGRITPGGTVTEFSLPSNSRPTGITAGRDGNLWFTESDGNRIGRITPGGAISGFTAPLLF